jgi:hypothetical protein
MRLMMQPRGLAEALRYQSHGKVAGTLCEGGKRESPVGGEMPAV